MFTWATVHSDKHPVDHLGGLEDRNVPVMNRATHGPRTGHCHRHRNQQKQTREANRSFHLISPASGIRYLSSVRDGEIIVREYFLVGIVQQIKDERVAPTYISANVGKAGNAEIPLLVVRRLSARMTTNTRQLNTGLTGPTLDRSASAVDLDAH